MKALVGDKMVSQWEQRFEKIKTQWRGGPTAASKPSPKHQQYQQQQQHLHRHQQQQSLPTLESPEPPTPTVRVVVTPKSPLRRRVIMETQPSKDNSDSTAISSSFAEEDCELCTTPLSSLDLKFPILCTSQQCHFNACLNCTKQMFASAQNDLQEASDGNVFFLRLDKHCPDCRSDFMVSLGDVVLLREHYLKKEQKEVGVQKEAQKGEGFEVDLNTCITGGAAVMCVTSSCGVEDGVQDSELTARQLRSKYLNVVEEEDTIQDQEYKVSLAKHRYEERIMDPHAGGPRAPPAPTHQINRRLPSRSESKRIRQRVQYIDSKLYSGWEHAMSEAEQLYVKELMTSGSEEQLAQATEILASISEMNKTPTAASTTTSTYAAPSHVPKLSTNNVYSQHHHYSPKSKPPLTKSTRPAPINRQGTGGTTRSTASSSTRNISGQQSRTQSHLQREFAERRAIEDMYPFPARMPVSVQLPVKFRPMDPQQSVLTFSDDESFYQDWKRAIDAGSRTRLSDEDRKQRIKVALVEDAYHRLSHNMWHHLVRKRVGNEVGVDHVKRGVRVMPPVQSETFIKDDDVDPFDENDDPWRRVVVTAAKGPIGRLGVRVGDVVTHVDGERFRGNADTLRSYLEKRRKSMKARGKNAMIASGSHIVVNADKGTAYALRTLSFLAATDFEKRDADLL